MFKVIFLFVLVTFIYKITPDWLFEYDSFVFLEQYLTIALPVLLFAFYEFKKDKTSPAQFLDLCEFKFSMILFAFVVFILIQPVNYYLSELTAMVFSTSLSSDELEPFWIGVLNIALMPAICEEILFRGAILSYQKQVMKSTLAIVALNGFLFALFHLNIEQFFYTFFMGAVFAYMSLVSRSIYPAMITHFLSNLLTTFEMPESFSYISNFEPIENLRMIAVLLLALVALYFVLKGMKRSFLNSKG
ncbi:type II CAAX endopeptidase family protein [Campylobacter geochelonis]|uniref:CAAX amino terminal protease self-immunity n=1 Tax=Campylobacter geochelonis TaxID=1780362 RepID=A0A128EE69_9BACT|nr:type II CAAX endopeptidase family protein [Campylobacter geochelonis]QKF71050.1 CPBP family intramembrane metalloprotease [Campylobacter geochelonis]CZE47219.1 CAAX amino terminal protease self-immunity [Campylobacter geochelonis]